MLRILKTTNCRLLCATDVCYLFLIIGPSIPPADFQVVATGPDSVAVSWSPPPLDAQNGIIIAYVLTCRPEGLVTSLPATYTAVGNYSLRGFTPATTYNCTVFATTAGGSGPPAIQTLTLLDNGNT